jgi:hypothetical protein
MALPGLVDFKWREDFRKQVADWNRDQCDAAWDVIRERSRELSTATAQVAAAQFHIGQRVQFRSSKRGGAVIVGTITRINTKTVALANCSDGGPGWRVHPSLLQPVTEGAATTAPVGIKAHEVIPMLDPKDNTTTILSSKDFTKPEWRVIQDTAAKNALFGEKQARIVGRECPDCHAHKMILVRARKVHPEVVDLGYRCVGCGATDSDVMD